MRPARPASSRASPPSAAHNGHTEPAGLLAHRCLVGAPVHAALIHPAQDHARLAFEHRRDRCQLLWLVGCRSQRRQRDGLLQVRQQHAMHTHRHCVHQAAVHAAVASALITRPCDGSLRKTTMASSAPSGPSGEPSGQVRADKVAPRAGCPDCICTLALRPSCPKWALSLPCRPATSTSRSSRPHDGPATSRCAGCIRIGSTRSRHGLAVGLPSRCAACCARRWTRSPPLRGECCRAPTYRVGLAGRRHNMRPARSGAQRCRCDPVASTTDRPTRGVPMMRRWPSAAACRRRQAAPHAMSRRLQDQGDRR